MVSSQVAPFSEVNTLPLVEAKGVSVNIGYRNILEDVDIAIHAGEIITIVGLNGAGKSTLVRVILGITKPNKGEVSRISGLKVGYTPQHVHRDLYLPITVRRFLKLGGYTPHKSINETLKEVGADKILDYPMSEISGGEMQRVLLARALMRKPKLLILDEPMAGVDIAGQSELYELISNIRKRHGCGVLLVSHDLHLVMAATDTVVCLNRHVCCRGKPMAVLRDPEFAAIFGRHLSSSFAIYQHMHNHKHDALAEPHALDTDEV